MLNFKKIFTISIIAIFLMLHTSISFASSDSLYVWSPGISETITTSSAINSNSRKFLKLNLWKWNINRS